MLSVTRSLCNSGSCTLLRAANIASFVIAVMNLYLSFQTLRSQRSPRFKKKFFVPLASRVLINLCGRCSSCGSSGFRSLGSFLCLAFCFVARVILRADGLIVGSRFEQFVHIVYTATLGC